VPTITDKDRKTIQEWFQKLRDPVRLVVFSQEHECEYCQETREIAAEVASLSDRITVEVHDFLAEANVAQQYGVDKIPAIAVVGPQDYGVRNYGFPSGYEFPTFVQGIVDVSTGEHGLSEATLQQLAQLDQPVHMQVFVTPT